MTAPTYNVMGLSEEIAAARLLNEGYNELPTGQRHGIFSILLGVMREPMFILLIACGALYLILGDFQEAVMLIFFVFVIIGITIYQERKTERALEALRNLSSPRALVIRDGKEKRIAGREVVRGDILILSEGDRIPADAVLISSFNFAVDESLLTGESVPVHKLAADKPMQMERPGGENTPFVYSSTLVVQGSGVAEAKSIGTNTEVGRIGHSLHEIESKSTPLQRQTRQLVGRLSIIGAILCTIVVVVYGFTRQDWLNGFLAGITLAMAMLPEEFPVVLTIFLALGAWRIAKKNVLTRRVPAIETLGAATVLCTDKTGTITQNNMTVKRIFADGEFFEPGSATSPQSLPEAFHQMVEFSILASQKKPFDPMEKAIKQMGEYHLNHTEHLHSDWELIHEYPLTKQLMAISHVWKSPNGTDYIIAAKGAPEAIADLCHLNADQNNSLAESINAMASDGLRVIGVAMAHFKSTELPSQQHDFNFQLLGLIGLADPIRPAVPAAIKECYAAGIRVVIITGDYPSTAQNIGRQIGLKGTERFMTGAEIVRLNPEDLRERVRDVNIFARVAPEQKLLLVNALKASGEIVGMTGDGVNDAPALKSADIGIAMGERGTDVARESAALVLLDDDFSSIVQTIKLGRRIYDNIRKAMAYIFAIHIPIAGLSLIPVLLKWPLILLPVHIVFLELIIDPACSIVFEVEPEEANVMHRPPRNSKEPLFGRKTLIVSLVQGLCVLLVTLIIYQVGLHLHRNVNEARALTFTTLIIANLGLILTNRSWSKTILATLQARNIALWVILGGTLLLLAIVLNTPFLRQLFHFANLHAKDLILATGAGIFTILWFEGLKLIWSAKKRRDSVNN